MSNILFSTNRLMIRNLKDSDLEDFYQYRSKPEIAKYQGFDPFSREQAGNFISAQKEKVFGTPGEWMQFGIEVSETGKLVGDCAIHLRNENPLIAELGITISDMYHRRGYAKETMSGLMDFLFLKKKIHRIVETVDAENNASILLLKSLSFRQEAHFINSIFFKGKWGSEFQFAMLRSEWPDRDTVK
jgi:[ribosomal protein S5]-alanine N-acetyltransferase